MITLSSSLSAHQKLPARLPAVRAFAFASRASYPILPWSRFYSGAEPDSPIALTVAPDGSLIRARNASGTLYTSRVTSPGPASTYSSWTNLTSCHTSAGLALASTTGELTLVYADAAGTGLTVRHSADNGASWGSATTRATEASAIGAIAVAYNAAGDLCVFYALGTSTTLKRLRRTSGTWDGSGTTWTRTADVSTITGIAATHHSGDFALIVTATIPSPAGDRKVFAYRMGDGNLPLNAWSAPTTIAESDSASTTAYAAPAILSLILASFAQLESGPLSANPAMLTHPPAASTVANQWAEPAPHEANHPHGLALASLDQYALWAATPSGVWFAQRLSASDDLSPRLISARYELTPHSASARLELDNHDAAITAANYPRLFPGAEILIQPGYQSGSGAAFEYGAALRFTVDRLVTDSTGRVIAHCSGPWETAARWRAPQAWQTPSGALSRSSIFSRIASRAGLPASISSSSSDFTSTTPAFAINATESGREALQRLLAVITDHVRPDTNGGFTIVNPLTTDTPTATYGGSGNHPITEITLLDAPPPANWARLSGPDRYADSATYESIYQHGPRLHHQRNLDATTNAKATSGAAAVLRRATLDEPAVILIAPFHCGQELFDLITVNSSLLPPPSSLNLRVIALRLDYARGPLRPHHEITLELGAP